MPCFCWFSVCFWIRDFLGIISLLPSAMYGPRGRNGGLDNSSMLLSFGPGGIGGLLSLCGEKASTLLPGCIACCSVSLARYVL
jgi:hypothetical protein